MTSSRERLKFAGFALLIVLGVALAYTILHEGGHALAGLAFGGTVREIDVNFFNLGAHVSIDGSFSRYQEAGINVSGAALPLLVWLVLILALPKKGSPLVLGTKFLATTGTLCSLLAWVVIPFLYLKNDAPAGDDVTRFLANSGLPPLAVAFGALALFVSGWFLFAQCFPGTRLVWNDLLGRTSKPVPAWRWVLAGGVVLTALIGAGILVTSTLGSGLPPPPKGYTIGARVDLSSRDRQSETIASFYLHNAGDAAIILRISAIDSSFIDVTLAPLQGVPLPLLHGENLVSTASEAQNQYRLPAGEYKIMLTSRKSSGILEVFFSLP
ncbi:MAG: M50 family metallopeptidase [Anaerolineales bacterium]